MAIGETGALAPRSDRGIVTPGADPQPRDARAPRGVPSAASVAEFIRGTTLLYPVLGSPIAQVKAPMLYNALFARTGLDAAVVPIEIAPEDYPVVLPALFRAKNVPGAFVTIPHKAATVALLDDCSDAARIAGACNAVVRRSDGTLYGDLFDGIGFVRAVEKHGSASQARAAWSGRAVRARRSPRRSRPPARARSGCTTRVARTPRHSPHSCARTFRTPTSTPAPPRSPASR
jgi:hypothetical protein